MQPVVEPELVLKQEYPFVAFGLLVCVLEWLFVRWHLSKVVAYLLAGILLGPAVLDIVYAEGLFALDILGYFGVALIIMDGGLHLDVDMLRHNWKYGILMGACGVVAPVLLSLAAVYLVLPTEDTAVMPSGFVVADGDLWTVGLAMGASLAPTSMGFSATMLKEYHQDKHAWAQLVLVAAIVDDVLSLFLLSMVSQISLNTGGGNSGGGLDGFDVSYVLYPLLALLILSVLAQQNNSRKWVSGVSTRPSMTPGVVHGCMLFAAFWLAWCSEWLGLSPLVGCFYAGLLFAQLDAEWIQKHWDVPVKPYLCWGTRLFFGATIPFAIPSIYADDGMLNGKPFGVGLLLTLVAVGGKMLTGVCIREERTWPAMLRTGIAMQGRGEISFLVATTARYQGLLTTTLYGGIVWALLIINCAAPLVLRYVLSTGGADALADANADANADAMTPRRGGGEEKTQEMEVRSRDADISKHLNLPTEHPLPPPPPFVSLYDK